MNNHAMQALAGQCGAGTWRRVTALCVTAACAVTVLGCNGEWRGGSGSNWLQPFRPPGEDWSILCMEVWGPDRQLRSERIAETLRRTPGIRPADVRVVHSEEHSRIYYGSYWRTADKQTGDLKVPDEMKRDMRLIKDLAVDGERFFYEARVLPAPTPDVGDPKWRLRNNPGEYTLRVAIFYNEPGFNERKKAAAEYCRELRERGYEAYYRHGDITSEVYVGSFGPDALVEKRQYGVLMNVPGPAVRALQRKENFMFELWNMKGRSQKTEGGKLMRSSRVVPVKGAAQRDSREEPW